MTRPSNLPQTILKLAADRLTGGRHPLFVCLSVTDRCNSNCSYCVYRKLGTERHPDPQLEPLFDLIDQLAQCGARRINLFGGEPLLREDLREIIAHIRGRGIGVGVNTNGILAPQRIEALRAADFVCLSLDALGPANDRARGPRAFEHALQAIGLMRSNGIFFYVNALVTNENIEQSLGLLELAEEYDFYIQYSVLFESADQELIPNPAVAARILRRLMAQKRKNRPVFFSIKAHRLMLRHYEQGVAVPLRCNIHSFGCTIDVNGDIYPCSFRISRMKTSNVYQQGFRKAFDELGNDCRFCGSVGFLEQNLIGRLDPAALWNLWRFSKRYRIKL
ncbi:MAG: radical SAM/SPASM domain-containing protein [Candidatus Alcyoniella australis]|nr:radical SAM/SPASM domain-containing protein [Candidatus Alcyoniella australis]